jgi:hypothetical protein
MGERLIKMDYERGKVIVMRTSIDSEGNPVEHQVELDLPETPVAKGLIRKVKHGDDGSLYETEEVIETPILKENEQEEG